MLGKQVTEGDNIKRMQKVHHSQNSVVGRLFVCFFVCFVALRPKSTAMVIAGRSVHLTTLFPGQA